MSDNNDTLEQKIQALGQRVEGLESARDKSRVAYNLSAIARMETNSRY